MDNKPQEKTMATLLETCRVLPRPAAAGEVKDLTLPLTFFDMYWLHFYPIRRILFYDHPCSKPEFLNTVVPNLKHSLSLTLKHYLPAAGNLLYPSNTDDQRPVLRYIDGDSVQLIIAESGRDFDELTANHARDSDQFYDFVPEMPPARDEAGRKLVPLIALQVTLLPGRGICLGVVIHHCLGDGRSLNASLASTWASTNKFGRDHEDFITLPNFDRSFIEDSMGIDTIFWEVKRQIPLDPKPPLPLPTKRVRATYTFSRSDIEKLKNRVLAKKPGADRVSSFVVTVSYIWSCLAKSDDDGVLERLIIPVDARGRLHAQMSPPAPVLVPCNYFGNCLGLATATIQHEKLAGEEGFETAAEAVAEEVKRRVGNAEELLKGAEDWMSEMEMQNCGSEGMRVFAVAGSPKYDLSGADFGWGKATKMENLTLDEVKYATSLCNSKEDGGLEFGLSLPKEKMEAFAASFADGLSSTLE